jgi:hypothetical protein
LPRELTTVSVLRRLDGVLRSPRLVPALALVAAVVALLSEHYVYPGFSWNRDEPVYLWQSGLLRHGQITVSDFGFPEVLQPWLTGHRDGVFFSQYPLGWPLALLVGQVLAWPALTLALSAALAVVGTYALAHEVTRDRRVAGLSASLFLASPIVAVQGGVYLTYLFSVGLGTLFTANFLAGVRLGSRRRVMVAGALLGWIVMTRTFDAVMWAAAVGGFVLVTERRAWRRHLRLVPPFLAAAVPLVVLQLLHNRHLSGNPLEFPITVADPLDTFGFGERRIMPAMDTVDYTPRNAVRSSLKNAFFLPWFLVGAYLGAAVAALGVLSHLRRRSTWLLVAICAAFPLGYFSFWGMHVSALTSRLSGPIYYIPVYVPLCVLMAQGFVFGARRHPRLTSVLAVAALVVTVPVGVGRLGLNRQLSRIQLAWTDATATIEGPAVVVLSPSPYLLYLNPGAGNGADLEDDIIWATDAHPSVIELIEAHPDRRAYVQRADVPTAAQLPLETTRPYEVEVVPAEIVRGPVLEIPVRVVPGRAGAVSVALVIDEQVHWRDVTADAGAGEVVETSWLVAADVVGAGPGVLAVPAGGATIEVLVGFGATPGEARATPSLKYEVLVQSGPTMRALLPGTAFRPDENIPDELVWRDTVPAADFEVSARGRPGT